MKKAMLFVVMMFVVLTFAVMPVFAGSLIPGISFPLSEERKTDISAGVNQLVTFSDQPVGDVSWFYKNGFLLMVKDSYRIFDDLRYCRIDPLILGVDPKFLQEVRTKVGNSSFGSSMIETDGDNVIMNVGSLSPGLYAMTTDAKHDASREDRRGLIPTFLQIFGIKKHNQVEKTDTVAMVFGVIDADDFIRSFSSNMYGVCDPTQLNNDQLQLLRSAFVEQELRGVVQSARPLPVYSLLADSYARKVQGFPGAFSAQQSNEMDSVVETLRGENTNLGEQVVEARKIAASATDRAISLETQLQAVNEALEKSQKQFQAAVVDQNKGDAQASSVVLNLQNEISELNGEISVLSTEKCDLQTKLEATEKALLATEAQLMLEIEANKKAQMESTSSQTKVQPAADEWDDKVRSRYAGQTGVVFVAVNEKGTPCGNTIEFTFFQMVNNHWQKNSTNPMLIKDGEATWFFNSGCYSWEGFGLTVDGSTPTKMFRLHNSGIRIIAIPTGGEPYEVY